MSRYTGPSWKISRRLEFLFQKLVKNWHVVLTLQDNTDQTAVAKIRIRYAID